MSVTVLPAHPTTAADQFRAYGLLSEERPLSLPCRRLFWTQCKLKRKWEFCVHSSHFALFRVVLPTQSFALYTACCQESGSFFYSCGRAKLEAGGWGWVPAQVGRRTHLRANFCSLSWAVSTDPLSSGARCLGQQQGGKALKNKGCNWVGSSGNFLGQSSRPVSSTCLLSVENFSLLGLPQVPKRKFNQRREKMQK